MSLLTRFHLIPPGVKKPNGNWSLLKTDAGADYKPFLRNHVRLISESSFCEKMTSNDIWNVLVADTTGKYLIAKHPSIQFLDLSETCGLTLLSHIQASGVSEKIWVESSRAGATHFSRNDAQGRTISEVLERTLLIDSGISLKNVWGSAIAPTPELARHLALEEAFERFAIYHAWRRDPDFELKRVPLPLDLRTQVILFEWEKYSVELDCLIVENPYDICVALVRIKFKINHNSWTFYGNGIGFKLINALNKALLESVQFIPGCNIAAWERMMTSSQIVRVHEWQQNILEVEQMELEKKAAYVNYQENSLPLQIFSEQSKCKTYIHTSEECPGIFLGIVNMPNHSHWTDCRGVPIV